MEKEKTSFIESTNRNRKQKSFKEFKQFSKEKTQSQNNEDQQNIPKENIFFGSENNTDQFVKELGQSIDNINQNKFNVLLQGYFHDSNIQSFDGEKIELKQYLDQLNIYKDDQPISDYQNLTIQQNLIFDEAFKFQLNKI